MASPENEVEIDFLPNSNPTLEQSSISPTLDCNLEDTAENSKVLATEEIKPSTEGQDERTEDDSSSDDGKQILPEGENPSVEVEQPSNGNISNRHLGKDGDSSTTSPSMELTVTEKGNSEGGTDMEKLKSETELRADGQTEISPDKAANGVHQLSNGSTHKGKELEKDLFDVSDYVKKGPSRYSKSLKMLIPFRPKPKDKTGYAPLDHTGLLSFLTLSWLSPIFRRANRNPLTIEDLRSMSESDSGFRNGRRFHRMWEEEVEAKGRAKASLGKVAFKFVITRQFFSLMGLLVLVMSAFITSAILIQRLLEYVEQTEDDLGNGLMLVAVILLLNLLRIVADSFFWTFSCITATRLKAGTLTAAFNRLARLRSLQDHSVGEIVNVCANDSQRLFDVCLIGNFVFSSIVMFIAGCLGALFIVGPGALLGTLLTFIVLLPVQMVVGKITSGIRQKCITIIDERVQKMNEILTFVKLIKVYAWETPFAKKIKNIRAREKRLLEKAGYLQSYNISIIPITPNIATVLSILLHIAFGGTLTIAEAFTLVSVLNTLRIVVGPTPWAIRTIAETIIALRRLKAIMIMNVVEPLEYMSDDGKNAAIISNATFGWGKYISKESSDESADASDEKMEAQVSVSETKKSDTEDSGMANGGILDVIPSEEMLDDVIPTLFDINLQLRKGQLTGVCGLVGSGKSSLLSALLGQMHKIEGDNKVCGSFAYAAQEAWIFNSTLQDNILFGKDFDKDAYEAVIDSCCLRQDLEMLTFGDKTEIGERGINLSGGQKQRVSLARALYADRDIYLLDDPLSAVDSHVGQHIFEHCMKGALKGKTVLFVTHQLQYLKDCDSVMVMSKGRITEEGTHEELMRANNEYARLITTFHSKHEAENGKGDEGINIEDTTPNSPRLLKRELSNASSISSLSSQNSEATKELDTIAGKLIQAEESSTGGLSWSTYHGFIKAMGGYPIAIFAFLCYVMVMLMVTLNNWWLTFWLNQGNGTSYGNEACNQIPLGSISDNEKLGFYCLIYGLSLVAILVIAALKSYVFMKVMLRAASSLHDALLTTVMRSPMSFFDTTPTGRILNRFSKDMDELDVILPINVEMALQMTMLIFFALLSIIIIFPWFLVAIVPILLCFIFILRYYRKGVRDLKRLENTTRSPWFSHISSTTMGLHTIHAYQKTDEFIVKFVNLLDGNAYPFLLFRVASRWAGMRLELLVITISTLTNLLAVLTHGTISPAIVGLAVSYTTQLNGMFQLMMSMLAEAEARFTSAERILQYVNNLEPEAPQKIEGHEPGDEWPQSGAITFKNFKMKYRPHLPLVLKGLDLSIKAGERVGIVGRTGSGKSSLGVALFRLVEPANGEIIIDDINIHEIGLHDLRSKLSIIPQDPVLFIGTVRYNLDPFEESSDADLWAALEKANMRKKVSSLANKLDSPVSEGGDNFSVGEKQLICMARALLRDSKILILDEATAAIDTETDALLQTTIRQSFGHCTLLTIAHRLNTVLDSDKILVMDDGKIAEFDTPSSLLAKKESAFTKMVEAAEAQQKSTID